MCSVEISAGVVARSYHVGGGQLERVHLPPMRVHLVATFDQIVAASQDLVMALRGRVIDVRGGCLDRFWRKRQGPKRESHSRVSIPIALTAMTGLAASGTYIGDAVLRAGMWPDAHPPADDRNRHRTSRPAG